MAWIRYVPPEEGGPELRALYDEFYDPDWQEWDNILRIHSPSPEAWKLDYAYYRHIMRGPGPLSRLEREMVAVVVSALNRCHY